MGSFFYTKILAVNLFAFAYRLFHAAPRRLERNLHETVCRQMQTNELLESLCSLYGILSFKCVLESHVVDAHWRAL